MKSYRLLILFIIGACCINSSHAQDDKKILSSGSAFNLKKDSTRPSDSVSAKRISLVKKDSIPKHDPHKATMRSLMLPGWGQAYNQQAWKIPFVYGIIAIPTVLYFYNNSYYKRTKFAYEALYAYINNKDSSMLPFIDKSIKNQDGSLLSINSYQSYRNAFRQGRDYSVLWFILAWGLQVADATVFGHLKDFDVGSDLSLEITPTFSPVTRTPGLGLTLNLKPPARKATVMIR
jgi:hypothetical protein